MSNMAFTPPPGLIGDDTVFAAPGRWRNGSLARFWQGNWQVKGGWERLTLENLGGVCRSVMGWTDNIDSQAVAFGLHNALKVWRDSTVINITPQFRGPQVTLGNNPLQVSSGSPLVVVTQAAHPYKPGDQAVISGAVLFNGIAADGTRTVTAVTANTWTFDAGVNATATGPGGGAAVKTQPVWLPGQIDGTGGAGYSTGAYGIGEYGEPSLADYFPLTWSFGTWGGWLLANPRGQGIYQWDGVAVNKAALLSNAPLQVTYMLSLPQRQVMAFGCNEEIGGVFNPLCIRWSDIEDNNLWASGPANNAGEWILESGGRIVCARSIGDYVLVWTTVSLFLGTFLGDPGQTWKFERVGQNCGAISPGAPVIQSQNAMWIAPDKTFWSYSLGGEPKLVPSPIRGMFEEYLAPGQNDKIVGATVSTFGEVCWFYADSRDGLECSRSLIVGPEGWSRDVLARSAYVDAGPHVSPIGVSPDGWAYWHEKGMSADGAALVGFIESTDFYLDEGDGGVMLNGIWPDFKRQLGVMRLTIFGREHPQSVERTYGPWNLQPGQAKRSFRVAARIARVRFDFASSPCFARGGKPEFDVQGIGGR